MNTQCIKNSNENRNLTFCLSETILVNILNGCRRTLLHMIHSLHELIQVYIEHNLIKNTNGALVPVYEMHAHACKEASNGCTYESVAVHSQCV